MQLRDNSDLSWERYGASDPYFGVITNAKFRKANLTAAGRDEFFASGERHVAAILAAIDEHFPGATRSKVAALDFGSGVGRLVIPLAKRFEHVTGVDVSPSMHDEARRNCSARGIANVTLAASDDTLSQVDGVFDLVDCLLVLQHIPRARGQRIIGALMRRVRPGGVFVIHVNLARHTGAPRKAFNWLRKNFVPLHWLANAVQGRDVFEPFMQMNSYNLNDIILQGQGLGFDQYFIERFHSDEYPGVLLFGRRRVSA